MFRSPTLTSVAQARREAKRKLPRSVYWWTEAGTERRQTVRDNREGFREIGLRARVPDSHEPRGLATTVLGRELSMPVVTTPAGFIRIAHPDGELGVARAAEAAGTACGIGILASYAIEEITAAASDVWFQLYMIGGREGSAVAIERAKAAGCRALIVTVDFAALSGPMDVPRGQAGVPDRVDLATALRYAPEMALRPLWALNFLRAGLELTFPNAPPVGGEAVLTAGQAAAGIMAHPPTWDDIAWVRRQWDGPLVVKGITDVDDARRAVAEGADAISVSNHGGNSLDGSVATIRALPAIAEAVGGEIEVLLDGGVRRGSDVVKALALGARAVLIGRPYIWALAAGGEEGVRQILEVYRQGIAGTLTLLGCPSVGDLGPSNLRLPPGFGA